MPEIRITPQVAGVLALFPSNPEGAVTLQTITALTPHIGRVRTIVERLQRNGYLRRVRRKDPASERNPDARTSRWWYWRSDEGAELLQLCQQAGMSCVSVVTAGDTAMHESDVAMMDPDNPQRGAVTFREVMHRFGFTEIGQYYAMDRRTRTRFHAVWTQTMYDACAAAGTPIDLHRGLPSGPQREEPAYRYPF